MNVVTIHQPEHLPYLGFFEKVARSHTLILLDHVAFEKNYFQNRNRIYTNNGEEYITVPVAGKSYPINQMPIAPEFFSSVRRKNLAKIEQAYKGCPFFDQYYPVFKAIYTDSFRFVCELNTALLLWVFDVLGINPQIIPSSSLNPERRKTDLVVELCRKVGGDKYLSGTSGKDYLELNRFDIPVDFQDFKHPVYTQYSRTEFKPYMSILDALFNVGAEIINIIYRCNGKRK